ncbi:alpha/beta hydrolase [Enterococcus faecalis]|uniref:alpha/beta fold hydrolase n=1 Tax=Enterococcus faecalis TaxID=1351 RepID=UPI001E55E2B8|nr:alpha/beta fold hydrolase [Enterococcus faecalis]MCD5180420.1 alpha/beta hydrolase [Enterococcus faecalis]
MKKMKHAQKYRYFSLLMGLVLLLSACQIGATTKDDNQAATKEATVELNRTTTPTLFFHGYAGTKNSFGSLLHRLEKQGATTQELVLLVKPDVTVVKERGALSGKATNPSVQVLFEDNKNNEWNQTEWIKNTLLYLQKNYQVNKANIVGHSMGGVSGLRYLGTYGQDASLPKIEKFVSIGAPFNDFIDTSQQQTIETELENGPTEKSSRYLDYQEMINVVPEKLPILLIGGQLSPTDLSDGTVPLSSALAVNALLRQRGTQVTSQIIKGENAQHSQLHENPEVDQLLIEFLWPSKK